MILKQSFTLIELLVTLTLSVLLLNFAFSYQHNFFKELKYLEAKQRLAMESYKATELIARGFRNGTNTTFGLIALKEYVNAIEIKTYNNTAATKKLKIRTTIDFFKGMWLLKIDNYKYPNNEFFGTNILQVDDMNNNDGNKQAWIYEIKHNRSENLQDYKDSELGNPSYRYARLIYTK
jgi:type II secretory pathway pseudopilin PulG